MTRDNTMSNAELPKVKVGDLLAFNYGDRRAQYKLIRVEKVTPSGRIVCGPFTLDPNLRIRGKRERWSSGPLEGEIVTQEVTEAITRSNLVHRVLRRMTEGNLYELPIEKLREVNSLLTPPEEQPPSLNATPTTKEKP